MNTETNFTRIFPPWKNSAMESGFPVSWLIIAGHLEETFHRKNRAENHPLFLSR
jgi:hypothetical protein